MWSVETDRQGERLAWFATAQEFNRLITVDFSQMPKFAIDSLEIGIAHQILVRIEHFAYSAFLDVDPELANKPGTISCLVQTSRIA